MNLFRDTPETGLRPHPRAFETLIPTHSASLRAFTPVFDGLWTRVNALMLGIQEELGPPDGSVAGAPRGDAGSRRLRTADADFASAEVGTPIAAA